METAVVDYAQYLQEINGHLADISANISVGIYLTVFALAVLLGVVLWHE